MGGVRSQRGVQERGMIFLLLMLFLSLSFALQVEAINRQSHALIDYMKRIEEFPQVLEGRQLREWLTEDRLPEGRLFINGRELKDEDIKSLMGNMNLEAVEEILFVRFGWTLRRSNMRMYPSNAVIHRGNPKIDYNQYTLLEPLTPLAILHKSRDGNWLYVHAPYMRGWVRREDVLLIEREKLMKVLRLPFLVVSRGGVEVEGIFFGLGSKLYYEEKVGDRYRVLLPDMRRVWIEKHEGLEEGYLSFREDRVRSILESLLGTAYDWGGKEGRWDCSSLVQSLYAVFGLELPRNSSQQAQIGRLVAAGFKSYEELKETLRRMPPFRTLLFMKGHVMVYGGFQEGEPVLYHAVHRLRREDGSEWQINSVYKNLLERDSLRNIYRLIVAVRVLD